MKDNFKNICLWRDKRNESPTKNIRKNVDASFRMKSLSCLRTAIKVTFFII